MPRVAHENVLSAGKPLLSTILISKRRNTEDFLITNFEFEMQKNYRYNFDAFTR